MVIRRALETNLIRPDFVHQNRSRPCIDAGAVDPDPSFVSIPGDAALCLISAADLQRDSFLVAGLHEEPRGRVPNAMRPQKLALPLYFHRTGAVESQTPMGRIHVMADPVHQHSSAVIEIPAPGLVDARRTIGRFRSGTEPALVVEGLRRGRR